MAVLRPLWTCPQCGHRFTTRNTWHSCGTVPIEALFTRSAPHVRRLFERLVEIAESSGPVTVIAQKSRIVLQVRMRFAAAMPQKSALKGHLVLARRCDDPRFSKIETFSPRSHVHVFRLQSASELDAGFARFVGEAYQVGCQNVK
jgi:16S rRNA G1207 methylase RsmC